VAKDGPQRAVATACLIECSGNRLRRATAGCVTRPTFPAGPKDDHGAD